MLIRKSAVVGLALGVFSLGALAQPIPVIDAAQPELDSSQVVSAVPAATPVPSNNAPNVELLSMVEQLQQEVQTLRGLVEEQAYRIKKMRQEQRDRYIDLDRRVSMLSQRGAPVITPNLVTPEGGAVPSAPVTNQASDVAAIPSAPTTADEQTSYKQAYSLIGDKKYEAAIAKFNAFLQSYPQGKLAPNAHYWLGELYIVMQDFEQAKVAFQRVVNEYSDHRKVSGATYKLATVYDRLGDSAKAKVLFQQVVTNYPDSSVAKFAKDYLRAMP